MRPKILHVTQATGGVETSLILLFRHLDHARFELHLVCPPGTTLGAAAAQLGVRVFPLQLVRPVNPWRDLAGLFALWRLMRRERYAVVHTHSAKGGYLGRLAARLAGVPVVLYAPRAFSYLSQRGLARRLFLTLERLAVSFTTRLVATSRSEAKRAVSEVRFSPARVTVIPNAVDFAEAPERPVTPTTHPRVLTMGRLSYQKNPELFVRMAARVAAARPDVRFVMVGAGFAGPLEGRVRELVTALGLSERVELVPWASKADALRLMSESNVFVLTSRFEGMPNTVLEAMMLSRPVVVTDGDGNRDVVRDGVTGLVVSGDEGPVADAVLRLLADPALAARLGRAARVAVEREHAAPALAARIAALYDAEIDSTRRAN
jgi:glycosyltransferase involved in cell wall biosynthesis